MRNLIVGKNSYIFFLAFWEKIKIEKRPKFFYFIKFIFEYGTTLKIQILFSQLIMKFD